ncbi:MAG TPA: hypothetical protein DEF59_00975 [Candidatus Magasanikbacteria bacterium]|nr:hypothetical protein [Candidatus Magasanikbacteria bacterium]
MPWWLVVVIIAYALNAVAAVVDKVLLSKSIGNPAVYAFYIAFLSMLGWVLAPFGVRVPTASEFALNMGAGIVFTFALLFLFKGLKKGESSRITPFVGALSPVFVWLFSYFLLPERLGVQEISALVFLVVGSLVLVKRVDNLRASGGGGFCAACVSAVLFGLSYTLTKYNFNHQPFVSAFVWMRLGAFLGGVLLLLNARNRKDILHPSHSATKNTGWFFFGQAAGACSFVLVNYAISLANVSLVNALQGVQYVFLLVMVWFLSWIHPRLMHERMHGKALAQKIIAIGIIGAGFALLL